MPRSESQDGRFDIKLSHPSDPSRVEVPSTAPPKPNSRDPFGRSILSRPLAFIVPHEASGSTSAAACRGTLEAEHCWGLVERR